MRLAILLICLAPSLAAAETTRATFDIYIGGLRAGILAIAGEERAGQYAAAGRLESVGLIGAIRKARYDAEVRGRVSGSEFGPSRYSETFTNGRRTNEKALVYKGGVPRVTPADERGRLDPGEQAGTIDPLTSLWGVLRNVPESGACRFRGDLFDGKRRASVALEPPRRDGERIVCRGVYTRVAGYDDDEMEKPRFPFRLTYGPAEDGRWRVERVDMESIFGRGAMVRR